MFCVLLPHPQLHMGLAQRCLELLVLGFQFALASRAPPAALGRGRGRRAPRRGTATRPKPASPWPTEPLPSKPAPLPTTTRPTVRCFFGLSERPAAMASSTNPNMPPGQPRHDFGHPHPRGHLQEDLPLRFGDSTRARRRAPLSLTGSSSQIAQEPARVGSFLSLVSASNSDAGHLGVAIGGDLGDGSGVQRRGWCLLLLLEVGAARSR